MKAALKWWVLNFALNTHMHTHINTHFPWREDKKCFSIWITADSTLATPAGSDITLRVYLRFLSCRLVELILPSIVSTLLSKESRETSWSSISACSPRPRFFKRPRPNDISSGDRRHTSDPGCEQTDQGTRKTLVFLTEVVVQLLMCGPQLFVLRISVLIGRPVIQGSRSSESCSSKHMWFWWTGNFALGKKRQKY